MRIEDYNPKQLSGRDRRLLFEWRQLDQGLLGRSDISYSVLKTNVKGLPISYIIDYNIRCICGVTNVEQLNVDGVANDPVYADNFKMVIELPEKYPQVDGAPLFRFMTVDNHGEPIPHPWHPNIRWFGSFAGRVCLNVADSYTDLFWCVRRVGSYLRYECYHAINEPPYPEDPQVAQWVVNREM